MYTIPVVFISIKLTDRLSASGGGWLNMITDINDLSSLIV